MGSLAANQPKRVFVFDNPRNRSHLFFRFLATHPELSTVYHPFLNAFCLGPEKIHYDIYSPERAKLVQELWEPICSETFTMLKAEQDFAQAIAQIEAGGKIPLANEHCCHVIKPQTMIDYTNSRRSVDLSLNDHNPTHFPDDLWQSITPVLVIRHPALSIPSLYRVNACLPALANLKATENHIYWLGTLTWARLVFDSLNRQGRKPIVVDGEDVCTRTEEVAQAVCEGLGLDPAGMSDTWKPLGKTLAHPVFTEMTRTIWGSDGVKKHKPTEPVSIDNAISSIQKEFGSEVASGMRTMIETEMENYNFLEQFKV